MFPTPVFYHPSGIISWARIIPFYVFRGNLKGPSETQHTKQEAGTSAVYGVNSSLDCGGCTTKTVKFSPFSLLT